MPAASSAVSALGGARKRYTFLSGVPRCVMAVSRFTIAMSALRKTGAIGANIVSGLAASLARSGPSKCTSPPKANVTAPRVGFGRVVVVVVEGRGARVVVDVTGADVVGSVVEARCALADEQAAMIETPIATITNRTVRTTCDATVAARGST